MTLQQIPIERLLPHPKNPRLAPRLDVIQQIAAQLVESGVFDEAHALIVRPVGGDFEIVSGHQRYDAALMAERFVTLPAWVREMTDEEAYMALVLNNAQGELSALEEGFHALNSGLTQEEYGKRVGKFRPEISRRIAAAEVAKVAVPYGTESPKDLSDQWRSLAEIHAAPRWLWRALVDAMLAGPLTIERTRAAVAKLKKLAQPPTWADESSIATAVVDGALPPAKVSDFARLVDEAKRALAANGEDADRLAANLDVALDHAHPARLSEVKAVIDKILNEQTDLIRARQQADLLATKRDEEVAARIARLRTNVSLEEWKELKDDERQALLTEPPDSYGTFVKQESDAIEWAQFSWNPVTGCLHDCPYCYARDIAVSARMVKAKAYPFGFAPTLRPSALFTPRKAIPPKEAETDARYRNVFTCSMADLFGRWVPEDWINAVLREMRAAPQWTFLCLTKFPKRMAEFDIPENVWMGTTIDVQARVPNAERAFAKVKAGVRWISVEPMLQPLRFTRLDLFDWIVVGGASASTQTPEWRPPFEWIADLYAQARAAGIPLYMKTNLLGNRILELPKGLPVPNDARVAPEPFHYLGGGWSEVTIT